MKTFNTLQDLAACVGQAVAVSDWHVLTQEQINLFAQATGDYQWIHVDAERARSGPFGTTIAHGFLTLSLVPSLLESSLEVIEARMGVNYGLNRVRFTAPVPVGSRLRGQFNLQAAEPLANNGWQFTWAVTLECEGSGKPACVAEFLACLYA